jgi:hypothetical protein
LGFGGEGLCNMGEREGGLYVLGCGARCVCGNLGGGGGGLRWIKTHGAVGEEEACTCLSVHVRIFFVSVSQQARFAVVNPKRKRKNRADAGALDRSICLYALECSFGDGCFAWGLRGRIDLRG